MATVSILTLGSCRVHGPLFATAESERCIYLNGGSGAYLHTGLEAIQRLRWIRGDQAVDPGFAPYVFSTENLPAVPEAARTEALAADILLVEIASSKQVLCRGTALQINYLKRRLLEPLGEDGERWWQQLVAQGKPGNAVIDRVLASRGFAEGAFGPIDEEILREASCTHADKASLTEELADLKRLWPKPIAIVTHVDMPLASGKHLLARERFVADVQDAAAACDVPVFRPADLFQQVGRVNALARAGADLDHINPDFEQIYGWYLLNRVIKVVLAGKRPVAAMPRLPSLADAEISGRPN